VDYERRREMLRDLDARLATIGPDRSDLIDELIHAKEDGRVKLYVTAQALRCRRAHPGLFSTGAYLPAEATGSGQDHVFGFARRQDAAVAIVVIPRLLTSLVTDPQGLPQGKAIWQDTRVLFAGLEPRLRLRNVFTVKEVTTSDEQGTTTLRLEEVLADFPVALLLAE
jgi:(1->4)-alpha-D-glucan 1-alpha-D-glucosylmutase